MVQFRELSLNYRWESYARNIFTDLDLCVPRGSFVSITGSNGSGKSSFLKLIMGLTTPGAGEVIIDGQLLQHGYASSMKDKKVAYLAQRIENLFFGDTVDQELGYNESVDPARIDYLLDRLASKELKDREIATLSGGERQAIALVQFLSSTAPLLVLDEPSSYLDRSAAQVLREELESLHRSDRTIIHATQFMSEVGWGDHHLDLDSKEIELVRV